FVFAALESLQRFDPLPLSPIRMQNGYGMFSLFQLMCDAIGAMLCPAKNQSTVKVRAFEQRHQEIELLFRGHGINRVCDRFRGRTSDSDLNHLRITQDPRREPFDLGRKCGGKKQRLSVGGDFFYDPPNIGQETHVEHPIDFIEDENVHVAKMHCALLEMIEQPTRRRDEDIDTALEILALLAVTDTAVYDGRAQIGKA